MTLIVMTCGIEMTLVVSNFYLAGSCCLVTEREAAAICFLVARPWRSMRKYGDRGMRFVFLEAGAMAQNIALVAVALGLGSVDCGSFYDDEVHETLDIDGVYETLIHAVFLGTPHGGTSG
jgi:SagB-type dehydrogenase family enzyme